MIATEPFLYRHFRIREAIRYPLILHFLACPRVILGEAVTAQEMAAATILVAAMVLGEAETVTEAVITQAVVTAATIPAEAVATVEVTTPA